MEFLNGKKRVLGTLIALGSTLGFILEDPGCQHRISEVFHQGSLGSGLMLVILGIVHAREKTKSLAALSETPSSGVADAGGTRFIASSESVGLNPEDSEC